MRHPDGTVLLCPDGKCGGAACVRCTPLLKRRVENWWGPAERRRALAAFGNVLATVGSAAPWTDVDDWAKLYRYTAKVHADTFFGPPAAIVAKDASDAEVLRDLRCGPKQNGVCDPCQRCGNDRDAALARARIVDGAKLDALAERWEHDATSRSHGASVLKRAASELRAALEGDK